MDPRTYQRVPNWLLGAFDKSQNVKGPGLGRRAKVVALRARCRVVQEAQ